MQPDRSFGGKRRPDKALFRPFHSRIRRGGIVNRRDRPAVQNYRNGLALMANLQKRSRPGKEGQRKPCREQLEEVELPG